MIDGGIWIYFLHYDKTYFANADNKEFAEYINHAMDVAFDIIKRGFKDVTDWARVYTREIIEPAAKKFKLTSSEQDLFLLATWGTKYSYNGRRMSISDWICSCYDNSSSDIKELSDKIANFSHERNWEQFHNGKDLSLALSIEASELNEIFLWKKAEDADVEKVKEELADIFNYAFLISNHYNLDVKKIILEKIKKNEEKYPIEKAYGIAKKYTELALEKDAEKSEYTEEDIKKAKKELPKVTHHFIDIIAKKINDFGYGCESHYSGNSKITMMDVIAVSHHMGIRLRTVCKGLEEDLYSYLFEPSYELDENEYTIMRLCMPKEHWTSDSEPPYDTGLIVLEAFNNYMKELYHSEHVQNLLKEPEFIGLLEYYNII